MLTNQVYRPYRQDPFQNSFQQVELQADLRLGELIEEFIETKKAQRLSVNTINDYSVTFRKLVSFIPDDTPISQITSRDIRNFLNAQDTASKKTVKNIYLALSSMWNWGVQERYCLENVIRRLPVPKVEKRIMIPFTKAEVTAMLNSLSRSLPYTRPGKRLCTHTASNPLRNRAIILFLLDLGLRASELCGLKMDDIGDHSAKVFGKGSKERVLPIGERAWQALEDYLKNEREPLQPNSFVFAVNFRRDADPLDRYVLRNLLLRIARRAGVTHCHPHRFRHTFAINYLRNGGDPYSLQMMLGHTDMEMVKHYLALATADLINSHRKASPADNWQL